jgi:hypothetical protein
LPLACTRSAASACYERGNPEQSVLYKVMQAHLATFLQTATAHDDSVGVPRFVHKSKPAGSTGRRLPRC